MSPAAKFCTAVLATVTVLEIVANHKLVNRYNRLHTKYGKKKLLVNYLAEMIDQNDVSITEFDKIAITTLATD